jgi:hypothetical protein
MADKMESFSSVRDKEQNTSHKFDKCRYAMLGFHQRPFPLWPALSENDLFGCTYFVPTLVLSNTLMGLSHEIFGLVFWAVWIYLGLKVNSLWFLNFNDVPLILYTYFKF